MEAGRDETLQNPRALVTFLLIPFAFDFHLLCSFNLYPLFAYPRC